MSHTTIPEAQLRVARRSQKLLGSGLARLYSAVTAEPVPGDLLLLLEEAERKRLSPQGVE